MSSGCQLVYLRWWHHHTLPMPCLLTHNSKQLLHFKLVCSRIPTNNISVKPVQMCAPRASIYKTPKQLKCKIYFPWISLSFVSWCQARWSHFSLTHGDLTMKISRRKWIRILILICETTEKISTLPQSIIDGLWRAKAASGSCPYMVFLHMVAGP